MCTNCLIDLSLSTFRASAPYIIHRTNNTSPRMEPFHSFDSEPGAFRGETLSETLDDIDLAIGDTLASSSNTSTSLISGRQSDPIIPALAASGRATASRYGPGPMLRRTMSGELGRGVSRAAAASAMQPTLAPVRAASAERARKAVPVLAVSACAACRRVHGRHGCMGLRC